MRYPSSILKARQSGPAVDGSNGHIMRRSPVRHINRVQNSRWLSRAHNIGRGLWESQQLVGVDIRSMARARINT